MFGLFSNDFFQSGFEQDKANVKAQKILAR